MKNYSLLLQGEEGQNYEAPSVTVITVTIEAGFSLSNEGVDDDNEQNPW